jgi:hypothetical protein
MPKTIDDLVNCCMLDIIPPMPVIAEFFGLDIIQSLDIIRAGICFQETTDFDQKSRKVRYLSKNPWLLHFCPERTLLSKTKFDPKVESFGPEK